MSSPAVPGDTTSNAAASVPKVTVMGRCPRCERWPWEIPCAGVAGGTF
jgi:hypothetical protein